MDSGEGRFEQMKDMEKELDDLLEQYPNHGGIFKVGEKLMIRGSRFRVKSIKPKQLILKLLRR